MALILPESSRLHLYYAPEATDDHPSYGFCKTDDGRCGYFHFDATGHYVWGRGDSPWLLYRLREILNPEIDRKSTRLNSSHSQQSRMPSSA